MDMDMVIRVDGRFLRLSPSNRKIAEGIGATGIVWHLVYCDGYYVIDPDGVPMMDVTEHWPAIRAAF